MPALVAGRNGCVLDLSRADDSPEKLLTHIRRDVKVSRPPPPPPSAPTGPTLFETQQREAEERARLRAERKQEELRQREEEKRRAKEAKAKKYAKPTTTDKNRAKRKPFNFEQVTPLFLIHPYVLSTDVSIADARKSLRC